MRRQLEHGKNELRGAKESTDKEKVGTNMRKCPVMATVWSAPVT